MTVPSEIISASSWHYWNILCAKQMETSRQETRQLVKVTFHTPMHHSCLIDSQPHLMTDCHTLWGPKIWKDHFRFPINPHLKWLLPRLKTFFGSVLPQWRIATFQHTNKAKAGGFIFLPNVPLCDTAFQVPSSFHIIFKRGQNKKPAECKWLDYVQKVLEVSRFKRIPCCSLQLV